MPSKSISIEVVVGCRIHGQVNQNSVEYQEYLDRCPSDGRCSTLATPTVASDGPYAVDSLCFPQQLPRTSEVGGMLGIFVTG